MRDTTEDRSYVATVRRGLIVFLIAAAMLAVFNSARLRSAVRDWPPSAVTDRIVLSADRWHGWMEAIGAAALVPAIHDGFERVRRLRWDG